MCGLPVSIRERRLKEDLEMIIWRLKKLLVYTVLYTVLYPVLCIVVFVVFFYFSTVVQSMTVGVGEEYVLGE